MSVCDEPCAGCPSATTACVTRPEPASIAIVFESPDARQIQRDDLAAGRKGGATDLVKQTLAAAGIDIDDCYLTTAVNCTPNTKKKPMLNKAMNACRSRLIKELKMVGCEKVLCLGPIGFSALTSLERCAAITKVRGKWHQAYGMNIMATVPPSFCLGERGYFPDFAHDIERFATTEGAEAYPDLEVWTPETLAEVTEAFEWLAQADAIGCDLETTGLSPVADDVLALGMCVLDENGHDATCVVISEKLMAKKKPWRLLGELLADKERDLIFHNAKFDLQFIKHGLEQRGLPYEPGNIQDTMMLHYAVDERPMGKFKSHSLKTLARVYYDAPDYDINMGKWLEEWAVAAPLDRDEMRRDMEIYMALDCYYTSRLFPDLWNEALEESEQLLDLYEDLLIPGTLALLEIEYHGFLLDVDMFRESSVELGIKANELKAKLQRDTNRPDFNPGSPKQVQEVIYNDPDDPEKPGLGLPFGLETVDGKVYHTARRGGLQEGPTAAPVLKGLAYRFPEHTELVNDIVEYRNLTKNIGTYVNGLLERADVDNRIRGNFNVHGTATGRLSSSNPNLQNIPDASHTGIEIRGGFIAPPGHVLIEADYKQLEVRIAAWLSDDDNMRSVFESDRDPHQEIAFSIYRKPKSEITHYMRWLAKNILFGLLYGRGYESVATGPEQEDIAARGGQRWSIEDVKTFYDTLLGEWADFAQWQKDQRALGYEQGYIETPTGRRKRFSFIPRNDGGYVGRASFNNPIQGTASDFTLFALIQLHARLPEGARIVSTVHDSIIFELREELVDEVSDLIKLVMEEETLFDIDVPLRIDLDVSKRWGEKDQLAHVPIAAEEASDA